ncbi:MAG: LPXTG cell wall anchor domain-containing protein, partial [Actinomycetia bacterium]|nr:LPXTG cell wall anchor domain-containing protein [Actinomycetes bacterium]
DTPPTIHVERPVLYVRQPATLTLADILRLAGVSITDPEETIPLSALQASGYEGIKWSVVNYPKGDGYVIRLNVSDTPGLDAPFQEIAIFVEAADTPVGPPPPNLPPPPPGKKWGTDPEGNPILYIPTAVPLALPQTGDVLVVAPLAFALAGLGALALVSLRRRRHSL